MKTAISRSFIVYRKWLIGLGFIFCILQSIFFVPTALAQAGPTLGGIAVNIAVSDGDIQEGDIISATKEGFKKSNQEYDVLIFGVVVNAPVLSLAPRDPATVAVVGSGEVLVRVSTEGGNIEVGDFITSSTTAGVGKKAVKSGYVIGKALEGYSDSTNLGKIAVLIGPSFGVGSGASGAAGALIDVVANPDNSRFILSTILGIIILLGSIFAFIRLITTGVTAIGRNPLARGIIYRSMVIASFAVAILAIAGAAAVIAIMTLGT